MEVKVVGFSKNAPFKGGKGYLMLEAGEKPWKVPLTSFIRKNLK